MYLQPFPTKLWTTWSRRKQILSTSWKRVFAGDSWPARCLFYTAECRVLRDAAESPAAFLRRRMVGLCSLSDCFLDHTLFYKDFILIDTLHSLDSFRFTLTLSICLFYTEYILVLWRGVSGAGGGEG
jgi:hypothetical protein